jgi:hypothetical protein
MTDRLMALADENGDIERALPGDLWVVPGFIEITGDCLIYHDWERQGREIRPGRGMLVDFLKLHAATDKDILDYARKWGVLHICKHGLPHTHSLSYETDSTPSMCQWQADLGEAGHEKNYREPIERWRLFSQHFLAAMRVARTLQNDRSASVEDWALLFPNVSRDGVAAWKPHVAGERRQFARVLNGLISLAGIRPSFEWRDARPRLSFGSSGLFGSLVLQLVLAASGHSHFAFCAHCGIPYMPTVRAPKRGQQGFCPDCRDIGIPRRYSARASYLRQKREGKNK